MASPSSAMSRKYRFDVFPSFHGPDVRAGFLSHLRKQFELHKIKMFNDTGIEKSQMIPPSLRRAIRDSRISIVILSKKYASSSWCLYELVEIMQCMKGTGQTVMTIFYDVDPTDVRNQTGDFGSTFEETCAGKTDAERRKWRQALTFVSKIQGEHLLNWDNEANMIEKIAIDVSKKLNTTISTDFEDMVGMEAHLEKMLSLLQLESEDEAMIIGISGLAGIGKSTIARSLYSLLHNRFELACFVDNIRVSYHSGFDEHGSKLHLQEHFLSKVFNDRDMRICHLGAIKENLCDKKVLIILDDVNTLNQLEALVNETTWFGPGSRIIVTTESQELLQQHGIDNMYHVGFPSREEALEILSRYAFGKDSMYPGFEEIAIRITELCGNLPLGLRVVGSSLRGKNEEEWKVVMNKLETILVRDIEDVLRVGYESLDEFEQTLFLHIALLLNHEDLDLVKAMFAYRLSDVNRSLKILVERSLIQVNALGGVVMHNILQQVGKQAIYRQEPWKRQILVDADEICDVLEDETGTCVVSGISFDISNIDEITVSKKAFRRMPNLRFLSVFKNRDDVNNYVHIPKEVEFPRCLSLLRWKAYPNKCLPPTFHPEYLVNLEMQDSKLEYLWRGTQPLTKLKKMDLSYSRQLKEFPDLSNATNLKTLQLSGCESLVELPSSIENLQSLEDLSMQFCSKLKVVPTRINLASLVKLDMTGCSRLKSFPDISTNIKELFLSGTAIEEVPKSVNVRSLLWYVNLSRYGRLKTLSRLPASIRCLDLSYTGIKEMADCIKDLHGLEELNLYGCKKLKSLPELPDSLTLLMADDCESLERVTGPLNTPNAQLNFTNCFKLSTEARKLIIQRSFLDGITCLPGRVIPSEFNHRAEGNILTISSFSTSSRFRACVKIMPDQHQWTREDIYIGLRYRILGRSGDAIFKNPVSLINPGESPEIQTEHLCIFHCDFPEKELCLEVGMEILFELNNSACNPLDDCEITECGIRILTNESERSCDGSKNFGIGQAFEGDDDRSYGFEPNKALEDDDGYNDDSDPSEVSED